MLSEVMLFCTFDAVISTEIFPIVDLSGAEDLLAMVYPVGRSLVSKEVDVVAEMLELNMVVVEFLVPPDNISPDVRSIFEGK